MKAADLTIKKRIVFKYNNSTQSVSEKKRSDMEDMNVNTGTGGGVTTTWGGLVISWPTHVR